MRITKVITASLLFVFLSLLLMPNRNKTWAKIDPLFEAKVTPSNTLFSGQSIETSKLTFTFTPNTDITAGGFIRVLIQATSNSDKWSDGKADSDGFDANKLTSANINSYLSPSGFSRSAASLTSSSGRHEILITLSSPLATGTEYSLTFGSETNGDYRFINPKAKNNHIKGVADIYPLAIQIEDLSGTIKAKTIVKAAINDEFSVTGVTVAAVVGAYNFTLFGYSSPQAFVFLEGSTLTSQTAADNKGYFEFKNQASPLAPQEVCLTAKDQLGRLSSPVCLPAFPIDASVSIGPVIMPPTLSFGSNTYYVGNEVILSGQAIPDEKVDLSVFIDENESNKIQISKSKSLIFELWNLDLVKKVEALSFPQLTTKSDNKGNFSLSLPSTHADFFRLFAQANYKSSPSPKSITLNMKIFPWWMIFIQLLMLLRSRLIEVVILMIVAALAYYLLYRRLHPHAISKNRALALRGHFELTRKDTALIIERKMGLLAKANNK